MALAQHLPKTYFLDDNTPEAKRRQVFHTISMQSGDAGDILGNTKLHLTGGADVSAVIKMHFDENKLKNYVSEAQKTTNKKIIACHLGGQDGIVGAGKAPEGVIEDRPSWVFSLNDTVEDIKTLAGRHGSQILCVEASAGGTTEAVMEAVAKLLATFKYVMVFLYEPTERLSIKNTNYYLTRFEELGSKVRTVYVQNSERTMLGDVSNSLVAEAVRLGCREYDIADFFNLLKPVSVLTTEAGFSTRYRRHWWSIADYVFDPDETYDCLRKCYRKLPVKSQDDVSIIVGDVMNSIIPKLRKRLFQDYKFDLVMDKFQLGIPWQKNIFVGLLQEYKFQREHRAVGDEHDYLMEHDP